MALLGAGADIMASGAIWGLPVRCLFMLSLLIKFSVMRYYGLLLSLLFMFFLLPACDDDNGGAGPITIDLDPASFEMNIKGDYTAVVRGSAIFSEITDPDTGEAGFVVYLVSHGGDNSSLAIAAGGGRPGSGTYQIVNVDEDVLEGDRDELEITPEQFVAWFQENPGEEMKLFFSNSGSLTLMESNPTAVVGTFEFDADGIDAADPEAELSVEISGQFYAIGGSVDPF